MIRYRQSESWYEFRKKSWKLITVDNWISENLIRKFDFCTTLKTKAGDDDDES